MTDRKLPSAAVVQALAVVCELTRTDLSPVAARVMAQDLAEYPEGQVIRALERCRKELTRPLALGDILQRIEDGRPTPEEAWAMIPRDEDSSAFWCDEMRAAYGVAAPLLGDGGNQVQARMAFIEKYKLLVQQARDRALPVKWEFTPGRDKYDRELVVLDAAQKGRITVDAARDLLPYHREDEGVSARLLTIARGAVVMTLPAPDPAAGADVRDKMREEFSKPVAERFPRKESA